MKISPNIGTVDRSIRLLFTVIFVILFYTGLLDEFISTLLLIIALLLTITSLLSYSIIYNIFNINTIYSQKKGKNKN